MNSRYTTNEYEIVDDYTKIWIDAREANVQIEASSDDSTKLVFFENKKRRYGFEVQDGMLTIRLQKRRWYNYLKIGFEKSEIKICVPKSILEALFVKVNVGSVDISSIACSGDIDVQTKTGKVNIHDVLCNFFNSKGNTGSIELNNLTVTNSVCVKRNTGKVLLNNCIANKFFVRTNTGKVCGKLPIGTLFTVKTNTGKIEVPQIKIGEEVGAICEVKTNTGSVKFQ